MRLIIALLVFASAASAVEVRRKIVVPKNAEKIVIGQISTSGGKEITSMTSSDDSSGVTVRWVEHDDAPVILVGVPNVYALKIEIKEICERIEGGKQTEAEDLADLKRGFKILLMMNGLDR